MFTTSGKQLPRHIDTLCVHGDEPTAYAVASETRRALEAAGVQLVPLPDLIP
ncbi:MAG: LamB/YcsF family protein [Ilumatobacteraceae bacterium]